MDEMQIEIRNLGVVDYGRLRQDSRRAFGAAMDRFTDRVRRVRVRLTPTGSHAATCRVRVWCGHGPTVVVEEQAATAHEAIHAVAATLQRALCDRLSTRRNRRRAATSHSWDTPDRELS